MNDTDNSEKMRSLVESLSAYLYANIFLYTLAIVMLFVHIGFSFFFHEP